MLEQIFASKTRVQIINLFVRNPNDDFYIREIARITGQYINSIRRELANLERFGFLKTKRKFRKKFYSANQSFFLFDELKSLFLKSKVFFENDLTQALKKVGKIKLLVFSGNFTGAKTETDLLIVGNKIKIRDLNKILEKYSKSVGKEVRYTLFTEKEYEYRQAISDKFLDNLFSKKHIILVDKVEHY